MSAIASAMADMLAKHGEDVDLTIGIEKAGGPIATLVARELETDLGTYTPRETPVGGRRHRGSRRHVLQELRRDPRSRMLHR